MSSRSSNMHRFSFCNHLSLICAKCNIFMYGLQNWLNFILILTNGSFMHKSYCGMIIYHIYSITFLFSGEDPWDIAESTGFQDDHHEWNAHSGRG